MLASQLRSMVSGLRFFTISIFLWIWRSANPFSRDSVVVERLHVFNLRRALNERSQEHDPTGIVSRKFSKVDTFGKKLGSQLFSASTRLLFSAAFSVHFLFHLYNWVRRKYNIESTKPIRPIHYGTLFYRDMLIRPNVFCTLCI